MVTKEDEVTTSMIIPRKLWEQAKILAVKEGTSLGKLLRKAIAEYIQKKESNKKGS